MVLSVLAFALAAAPAPEPDATKPEKKICRSLEVTGSIMPKATCHTKAQWAAIDSANNEKAREARDAGNRGHNGPGSSF